MSRHRCSRPAGVAVFLALTGALAPAAALTEAPPEVLRFAGGPVLVDALRRLRAEGESERGGWRSHVAKQALQEAGPSLLPALWAALNGKSVALAVEGPELRPDEGDFLIESMRSWPRRHRLTSVLELVSDVPSTTEVLVVARLFHVLGEDDDLLRMARFLRRVEPPRAGSRHVQDAVEKAFHGLLEREPRSYEFAQELFDESGLPPVFDPPLARALGALGSARSLPYFERLLAGTRPRLEILAALGGVTGADQDDGREAAARLAERFLYAPDPRVRRQVLLTLAELGEPASTEHLLLGLEDADPRVRRGALQGLRRVSGRAFESDPDLWRRWFDGEVSWFAEEFSSGVERLSTLSPGDASAFLREAASHRQHRGPITRGLLAHLSLADVGLLAPLCHALGRLEDPTARGPLRELTEHPQEVVRTAAHVALRHVEDAPVEAAFGR